MYMQPKNYLKENLQLKCEQTTFLQTWMGNQMFSALEIWQTL